MILNRFNRFLFAPADDAASGGGAGTDAPATTPAADAPEGTETPAEEPEGEEEETPAAEPAPAPEQKVGLLAEVRASLRSRGALLTENKALLTRAETAEQQLDALRTRAEAAEARVTELEQEQTGIRQALADAQAANASTETAAAALLEQRGFAAPELPSATQEGDTVEALEAKLDASTDPDERFRLTKQILQLEKEQADHAA